ncbi:MAG: DUF1499 domain-containing protein [Methanobacteriota archaeon]
MGSNSAEGSFLYGFPPEKVFKEATKALLDCKFKIEGLDEDSGFIKAYTPTTLTSWAQDLEVAVSEIDGGTRVDVSCKTRRGKYDGGRSRKSVDKFFENLNKRFKDSVGF